MSTIPTSTFISTITTLLTEAYEGPPNPKETWFIDNEPDSGILGILKNVSAAEASTSVDDSGKEGSTIAANVEHLRWSIANANRAIRGGEYQGNWAESWALVNADETAWDRLRVALRAEFESLREGISQAQELQEVYILGLAALIPHAAFHLGVIRQMIERVRATQSQKG